jgi:Ca2+-binding EF-hand superfamily protein
MNSEKQIHRIFSLFDHDNDGHIANRELSTVLRLLGRNPTNEEIVTLVNIYYF